MEKRHILRLKRYLSKKDFSLYLENIRKIADYDPENKWWKLNIAKIKRIPSKEEIEKIISILERYIEIDRKYILDIFSKTINECYIDNKLRINGIEDKNILSDLSEFIIIGNNYIKIKSILYLKKIIDYLKKKKINVNYNQKLSQIFIMRKNSHLLIKPFIWDNLLIDLLKKICTISFYVERAVLGSDKTYMGTEIITRKNKAYKIDWNKKIFITYVAFLYEIKSKLLEFNLNVIIDTGEARKLDYQVNEKFNLLPHQQEAYQLWKRKKRGTIAIFTRGGKSFIGMKAISDLKEKTIIFVPTRELATTWRKYLEEYLGLNMPQIGLIGSGTLLIRDITIAIYNSGVRHLSKLQGHFELAIFDEAHHVPASTFKEVALQIDALHRMALSATPKRRDNNEQLLFKLSGDLVYSLGYKELLQLRIVAPIEIYKVFFAQNPEEKIKYLLDIVKKYNNKKTLIFTQYLTTAQEIYGKLLLNGYKALLITGQTSPAKRKRYFEQFIKGLAPIMVSTTVLDEGITVPDAEIGIIYENSGEPRQLIQRIGRVLGYKPGKTAKIFEIVDISNPKEKYAYLRRKWVQDLYNIPELEKYIKIEKNYEDIKRIYQPRLDFYDTSEKSI